MTESQFNDFNERHTMPQFWIGQGYGYKDCSKDWDDIDDDEIIYIPESGYIEREVVRTDAYSKRDFIDLIEMKYPRANEELKNRIAEMLFQAVDWQFPETALDEEWLLDDDTRAVVEEMEEVV